MDTGVEMMAYTVTPRPLGPTPAARLAGEHRAVRRASVPWTSVAVRVVAVLTLAAGPTATAQSPPHWSSASVDIGCTSQCHVVHQANGWLTQAASNVALCQSCHSAAGLAADLPLNDADRAQPGVGGTSHGFDVAAVHPGFATQLPQHAAMAARIVNDTVICSTCHNQHQSTATLGGTPRVGNPAQITSLGSTGSITSGGVFSGPEGVWYLIEIAQQGNQTTALFRFSKDNGGSWTGPATAGVDVALDAGVTVSFSPGTFETGERWEFSAAWPFLRAPIDAGANVGGDAYCRDCHRAWVMDHVEVEIWDGTPRSHPVGVPLNANARDYDRPVPLDGNGAEQGGAGVDSNRSNDLALDASGRVQCLSCHGVHNVDSNTLTDDFR